MNQSAVSFIRPDNFSRNHIYLQHVLKIDSYDKDDFLFGMLYVDRELIS